MLLIYIALIAEAAALFVMFHALFTIAWATGEERRYKRESLMLNALLVVVIPLVVIYILS